MIMFDIFKKNSVKVEYDLSENFLDMYSEAYGVATMRKRLLKKSNTKTFNYVMQLFIGVLILAFYTIIVVFCAKMFNGCIIIYNFPIMVLLYLIFFIYYFDFLIKFKYCSSRKKKGYFLLDDKGLTDYTFDGITITFDYKRIEMIVVKKNVVVILTDTPIYFFADVIVKDKIIDPIKKYKKDVKIVEK